MACKSTWGSEGDYSAVGRIQSFVTLYCRPSLESFKLSYTGLVWTCSKTIVLQMGQDKWAILISAAKNGKTVLNKTCLKNVKIYIYLAYICQSALTWAECGFTAVFWLTSLTQVWSTGNKYLTWLSGNMMRVWERKVASLAVRVFARDAVKQNCHIILRSDATGCSHTDCC